MTNQETVKAILEGLEYSKFTAIAQDMNAAGIEVNLGCFANNIDALVGNMVQVSLESQSYLGMKSRLDRLEGRRLEKTVAKMAAMVSKCESKLIA